MNNGAGSTKTTEIFKLHCPWENHYQGKAFRMLFVCSAGLLRSPTGAAWAIREKGWNARSCGSEDCALIPLSADLIMWAKRIIFVHPDNFDSSVKKFTGQKVQIHEGWTGFVWHDLGDLIHSKSVVLQISDTYDYDEESLLYLFRRDQERMIDGIHGLIVANPYGEDYQDQWIGAALSDKTP